MTVEQNLKKTRKNLYRTWSMDGIGDMTLSIAFLALGAQIYFDSIMFIFVIVMIAPLTLLLKKKIVYPRIGYYNTESLSSSKRLDVNPTLAYTFVAFLFLVLGLGVMKAFGMKIPAFIDDNYLIIIALAFVIPTYYGAFYTGIKRVYIYATVILILFINGSISEYPTIDGKNLVREALGIHLMIFGAVVFLFGLVLFIRFLIQNPIVEDSENEI
jgi:hypothetical protein